MNIKFLIVVVILLFHSCHRDIDSNILVDKDDTLKVDSHDSIKVDVESKSYYVREIKGKILELGPDLSNVKNEVMLLRMTDSGVIKKNEGIWESYFDISFVRDKSGQKYELSKDKEYRITNGVLSVNFQDEYLEYDYNLLISRDMNYKVNIDSIFVKFRKGSYCKGEQFIEFATIDTIYSDFVDLSIFIGTDVEIDFNFDYKKTYCGDLFYVRDKIDKNRWYRDNFKFDLSK